MQNDNFKMIKRYLLTLFALLALVLGYCLTLLPLLVMRHEVATATSLKALLLWGFLALLSFPFFVSRLVKKIWFFQGSGEAVPEKQLRKALLVFNGENIPFTIHERGKRMRVQWRFEDPFWGEHLAATGIKRFYELHLSFAPDTRTVTVTDYNRRVDLDLCPIRVRPSFFALPRPCFQLKLSRKTKRSRDEESTAEIIQNISSVQNFHFKPEDLKTPVVQLILKHGWNVRFALF